MPQHDLRSVIREFGKIILLFFGFYKADIVYLLVAAICVKGNSYLFHIEIHFCMVYLISSPLTLCKDTIKGKTKKNK